PNQAVSTRASPAGGVQRGTSGRPGTPVSRWARRRAAVPAARTTYRPRGRGDAGTRSGPSPGRGDGEDVISILDGESRYSPGAARAMPRAALPNRRSFRRDADSVVQPGGRLKMGRAG